MPRRAKGISSIAVRTAGKGRYFDGDGLVLLVRSPEVAFWEFAFTLHGKRRTMGLGRARGRNALGLADARDKVGALRKLVKDGTDPIAQQEAAREAKKAEAQEKAIRAITFRTVAQQYIAAHEAEWHSGKTAQQWANGFEQYVHPQFGDLPIADISKKHVTAALEPLWKEKPDVASRLRARIASVFDYAKARDWCQGENPAAWRGNIKELLPKASKVRAPKHHPALPWREIGAFMASLGEQNGNAALALRFAILTAARSGEVRGMTWAEIDLANKVWTVPASRIKARREHRVPLSEPALALLHQMREVSGDKLAFAARQGQPLSDMALLTVLRRMGRSDLTVHGFRSTFRDWCAEYMHAPRELAEAALAHAVGNKTEAAYFRGDLFDRRRKLMEAWAEFCAQTATPDADKVVRLERA